MIRSFDCDALMVGRRNIVEKKTNMMKMLFKRRRKRVNGVFSTKPMTPPPQRDLMWHFTRRGFYPLLLPDCAPRFWQLLAWFSRVLMFICFGKFWTCSNLFLFFFYFLWSILDLIFRCEAILSTFNLTGSQSNSQTFSYFDLYWPLWTNWINPNQPESIRINPYQPVSTRINQNQLKSTQINPN